MKKESIYSEVLSMLNDRVDYKSITLLEVANRCGMGKSTIYEYFSSKDEMIFNSMIYYLNSMIKFFSQESFEVTSFHASLRTYIKAVMISMKGNFWMVMPWTFTDSYSSFLLEEDATIVDEMLKKCQQIVYSLFSAIIEKGQEEGLFSYAGERSKKFAYNALIMSISEKINKNYDVDSEDCALFIDEMCDCIIKEVR